MMDQRGDSAVHASVADYYGRVLQGTSSLRTSACLPGASRPSPIIQQAMRRVPTAVSDRFYGCGAPLPLGIAGLTVLDLGCGSGRDCYVSALLVGQEGRVIGIDMTDELLQVARDSLPEFEAALGYRPNLSFVKGYIEDLSAIASQSVDIIISNCVINLSPRKDLVLREAARVLKQGGEMYFSDVYADRRLPQSVREHKLLWGECIAGALYEQDFIRLAHQNGFLDVRSLASHEIHIGDDELRDVVGNAKFFSITYRLFKLPTLETLCEDYGQVAVYKGTLDGNRHAYTLDDHHVFVAGKPVLVCGNTASMLSETWLARHFTVTGDRTTHYGLFDCSTRSPGSTAATAGPEAACSSGTCC